MNLNLYDTELNRIAIIGTQYVSCYWSEGYNTVENFSLELIATDDYKKKVRPDCYVGRNDRETLMVIKDVDISSGKIVAIGKQAARVLDDVSFVGTINENSRIDESIKIAYNNSNKYPRVVFADSSIESRYRHQISNKSILGLCKIMCQSEDVGFRAVRGRSEVTIELYKKEANPNLVLSEKFGNLFVNSISISTENYKNYAIVLGEGEEENRKSVVVDLTNGEQRRDIIIDARDIVSEVGETEESYLSRLYARGIEKLLERQTIFFCDFTPHFGDFGKRYDLGDVVTVFLSDYNIKLQSRILRFTQIVQENQTETNVEVGKIIIL